MKYHINCLVFLLVLLVSSYSFADTTRKENVEDNEVKVMGFILGKENRDIIRNNLKDRYSITANGECDDYTLENKNLVYYPSTIRFCFDGKNKLTFALLFQKNLVFAEDIRGALIEKYGKPTGSIGNKNLSLDGFSVYWKAGEYSINYSHTLFGVIVTYNIENKKVLNDKGFLEIY